VKVVAIGTAVTLAFALFKQAYIPPKPEIVTLLLAFKPWALAVVIVMVAPAPDHELVLNSGAAYANELPREAGAVSVSGEPL
jgi:hypothetical protein